MYRTAKGYNVENVNTDDVYQFGDFNKAKEKFDLLRYANSEFLPMTLEEAQNSALTFLRESTRPAEGGKVLPFKKKSVVLLNTPQQAALDLAQKRAALPVEQGGLGLPANNTPEMRMLASGNELGWYHGTTGDITKFRPELLGETTGAQSAKKGFFFARDPQIGRAHV